MSFVRFSGPWETLPEMSPKWSQEVFLHPNLDLANVLGDAHLDVGTTVIFVIVWIQQIQDTIVPETA